MRNGTSFATWLEVIVGAAALVLGCRQETPPAPTTAAKVAEIAVVNPARGFMDSIALSPDASHVATGERNGSIRVWAHASGSGSRAYHTVAITDAATGFAAITSALDGGKLTYGVEIWQIEP